MNYAFFLTLVRLGVEQGSPREVLLFDNVDWEGLEALAEEQGLSAFILDGLEQYSGNVVGVMPKELKLRWIGVVMRMKAEYGEYTQALASLANFYSGHKLKMMVLKGYACALDWPKPDHRPCGDIDIWLFGKQKTADEILAYESGIEVDNSHHHHTVFYWKDFMVENHYDFLNVHHHKSNAELERVLKKLGENDTYYTELNGAKVYLPSPNLHALFLLRHTMAHFAATEITLKNLLDWAYFIQVHGEEVDWKCLMEELVKYGMIELFHIFNAICVEDLGFDAGLFPPAIVDETLKAKVLHEILDPEIPNEKPRKLLARVVWKIRRWKSSEWKHQLCYSDSMWSAFWSGVWNHLLKPSSI